MRLCPFLDKNLLMVPQQSETKIQIPSRGYRTLLVASGHSLLSQLPFTLTLLQSRCTAPPPPHPPTPPPPPRPLLSFHSQDLRPGWSLILAHSWSLCGLAGCLKITFLSSHGHHPICSICNISQNAIIYFLQWGWSLWSPQLMPSTELEMALIMILKGEKLSFRSSLCQIPI